MMNMGMKRKLLVGGAFVCLLAQAGYAQAQEVTDVGTPPLLDVPGDDVAASDAGLGAIEDMSATAAPQTTPVAEPATPVQNLLPDQPAAAQPDDASLNTPGTNAALAQAAAAAGVIAPAQAPLQGQAPAEAQAPLADINVPIVPATPAQTGMPDPNDNVFYDAEAFVPEGQLATQSHRKADPRTEPASVMVFVEKNASANSREARLVAAERALKLGRESSALEIYNDLYKKNRKDRQVLMGRAVALQKLGLEEEAILAYEELLDVQPNNVDARANMLGLMSGKYPSVALRQLKDLRGNNPENVALVAQLGIAEAQMGNFDSAIRYMGVAASMEPNNANHYYNLAVMADKAGAKKDAVRYYEQALEIDTVYGGSRSIPREAVYQRLAKLR